MNAMICGSRRLRAQCTFRSFLVVLAWLTALATLLPVGTSAQSRRDPVSSLVDTPTFEMELPAGRAPMLRVTPQAIRPRHRKLLLGAFAGAAVGGVIALAACPVSASNHAGIDGRTVCAGAAVGALGLAGGVIGYVMGSPRSPRAVWIDVGRHRRLRLVGVVRP